MFDCWSIDEIKRAYTIILLLWGGLITYWLIGPLIARDKWQSASTSYEYLYSTGDQVYIKVRNNYIKSVVVDIYNDETCTGPCYRVAYGTDVSYTTEIVGEDEAIPTDSVGYMLETE